MGIINKRNLIWNSASFILISILGFINFTLNIKTYNSEVFGYYLLLNAYWSIGSSIDFGFGVSTIKSISEYLKKKEYENIKKLINTFLVTYFVISIVIASIIYLIYYLYNLNVGVVLVDEYDNNNLMILFGLGFILKYLSGFLMMVFEGLGYFVQVSQINLSMTLFVTFLTVIIYIFKLSLYYLLLSQIMYAALLFAVLIYYLFSSNDYLKMGIKYFDIILLRKFGHYNFNIQVSFILNSLIDPIIKSVLSYNLGLQFVTYFETAKRLINLTNGLINSAIKGLLNKLSEENAIGELKHFINSKIQVYSNLALDYSLIVYGVFNPIICLFILNWFKNYESMIIYLLFMLPYSIINFAGPLYLILMVEGRGGKLVLLQFINVLLVSVILYISIFLLNSYLGLLGFYAATILNSLIMFYLLQKYNGFNIKLFFSEIKVSNLVTINIFLIFQVVFVFLFPSKIYLTMIIFTIIFTSMYFTKIKYYSKYIYGKFKLRFINK